MAGRLLSAAPNSPRRPEHFRRASSPQQNAALDIAKSSKCLDFLKRLGSNRYDDLNPEQVYELDTTIEDLRKNHNAPDRDKLAQIAMSSLAEGRALVSGRQNETLQLLGFLASDSNVSLGTRQKIAKMFFEKLTSRAQPDRPTVVAVAQILASVCRTQDPAELAALNKMVSEKWASLIDSLSGDAAVALVPAMVNLTLSDKLSFDIARVDEMIRRLHRSRSETIAKLWAQLSSESKDTTTIEEWAKAVEGAIDAAARVKALKSIPPKVSVASSSHFYQNFQTVVNESLLLDKSSLAARDFLSDADGSYEDAQYLLTARIENAAKADVLLDLAKDDDDFKIAYRLGLERYRALSELSRDLTNQMSSSESARRHGWQASDMPVANRMLRLKMAQDEIRFAMQFKFSRLALFDTIDKKSNVKDKDLSWARLNLKNLSARDQIWPSEIPFESMVEIFSGNELDIANRLAEFLPSIVEKEHLEFPHLGHSFGLPEKILDESLPLSDRRRYLSQLNTYLDRVTTSIRWAREKLFDDQETPIARFKMSQRISTYISVASDALTRVQEIELGLSGKMLLRSELADELASIRSQATDIYRRYVSLNLFIFAPSLGEFLKREAILKKYMKHLYAKNGSFKIPLEVLERLVHMSAEGAEGTEGLSAFELELKNWAHSN